MSKPRHRPIHQLYHVTDAILEPQMTPVLRGNYRIQGPSDETDCCDKKTSSSQAGKEISRQCVAGNVGMQAEPGTCNVCAAPCSSCRHFKQGVLQMEIKAENKFSDEVSAVNAGTRCSFNEGLIPSFKRRARTDRKSAATETNNIRSASSSQDSISKNTEKQAIRTFDSKEDVEMLPKRSYSESLSDDKSVKISSVGDVVFDEGQRETATECAMETGDDASCVSGANDAPILGKELGMDLDTKNELCTASVSGFSPDGGSRGFQEIRCSQLQVESSEHSDPCIDSTSEKREASTETQLLDKSKCVDATEVEDGKSSLIGTSWTSVKDNSGLEAGMASDVAEPTTECIQHLEKNEIKEQPNVSPKVSNNDGSDGSDIVEDDVKVCDICGDAGREDLLAICSRCSDGAEHTYCMRIMIDKVPQGEWLCEVCKMKEEAVDQKKNKSEIMLGTPKESCLSKNVKTVGTLDSKVSHKSDTKFPNEGENVATKVAPHPRIPSKRQLDDLEVPFTSKRQALDSSIGPSSPSSPNKKTDILSRERSFKNLEKGKLKQVPRIPPIGGSSKDNMRPPAASIQSTPKIQPSHLSPKGKLANTATLLKSSSFNNAKPKVKRVEEDVSQNNKLGKHPSTIGARKDGISRTIGRSSSFSGSRPTSVDSKAKGHSSNLSRTEDFRGIKPVKERNVLERRNSIKSDRIISSIAGLDASSAKDENKVSSRDETLPSISKSSDLNTSQTEERLTTISKPASLLSHRGSETSNASGRRSDFKRPSSSVSRGGTYPSLSGNFAEREKPRVNLNNESAATHTSIVDRPNGKSELVSHDGVPQSREVIGQGKKSEESSFSQSRNSVPAAARNLKEVMSRSMKSKDGNEAVFVKSPGICKTSGLPYPSNELSMPNAELICEGTPKDQLSNALVSHGNLGSSSVVYDRQESYKHERQDTNKYNLEASKSAAPTHENHNALKPPSGEGRAANEDIGAIVSSDGVQLRPSVCNLQARDPAEASPLRILSIPEPDYIWQGGFEVERGGRHCNSFNGIQAHLSSCVSPKVFEVVNAFPHNVLLEEVPRLSTWPTQFQNCATEDSIALYFFAKDIESYLRNYQSLVENLMKNDLALRGVLNGVELLIFPSNQLCEKSQRWNMLYFLWGVFRAKRTSTSVKLDFPITQNGSSFSNKVEDSPMVKKSSDGLGTVDSSALQKVPSSSASEKDTIHYQGESLSVQKCSGLETKSGVVPADTDSESIQITPTSDIQQCSNSKENGSLMLGHGHTEEKVQPELQQGTQEARDNICSTNGKISLLNTYCAQAGPSPQRHDACSGLFKCNPNTASLLPQDVCAVGSEIKVPESVPERMTDSNTDVTHRKKVQDDEVMVDADSTLREGPLSNLVENDDSSVVKSGCKRSHLTMEETVPQSSGEPSVCTDQTMLWKAIADDILVNKEKDSKRIKTVYSRAFPTDNSKGHNLVDLSLSQRPDLRSTFPINEQEFEGVDDSTMVSESSTTTEKYLFPVMAGPIKDVGPIESSIPVQVISSDDDDPSESECPNLDLALGGEKKPPKQKIGPLYELLSKKKNDRGKSPEIMTDNGEDDSLGSLSLSLAVPFSGEVAQMARPIAKPEPKRSPIDTSLLFFGSFSNN